MSIDELKNLQKRYETPGEGYGHFKLTLLEKIEEYFNPYIVTGKQIGRAHV